MSAGPDGIYYSASQGFGTVSSPRGDIVLGSQNPDGARVGEKYDDLLIAGGS